MPKKAIRASSNVFSMFEQNQILEFKEAFGMLDQDADGTISLSDLKEVYNQLGRTAKDADLKQMLSEAEGPLNFTGLLQLFGAKLNGTDEESMLMNAFKLFDNEAKGTVHKDGLRELLTLMGNKNERLTDQEFNQILDDAPLDNKGNLDYAAFAKLIKRGKNDDE